MQHNPIRRERTNLNGAEQAKFMVDSAYRAGVQDATRLVKNLQEQGASPEEILAALNKAVVAASV